MPLLGSEAYYAEPLTSCNIAAGFERNRRLISVAEDDNIVPALRNDDESMVGSEAITRGRQVAAVSRCERKRSFNLAAGARTTWCQLSRMSAMVFLSGSALFKYIWNLILCPWKPPINKPEVSGMGFARCRQWSASSGSRSRRSKQWRQKMMS